MKKIDTVLTHLISQPIYAKLRRQECFHLIKKALPPSLQRGILFIFVKNRTLFFALKHPAFKMEFDYKLSSIKNLLSTLPPLKEACKAHEIKDVKAFVSKFAPEVNTVHRDSIPRYKERAQGVFDILVNDEMMHHHFKKIQETIQKNSNR
jgi:hypothetical protein